MNDLFIPLLINSTLLIRNEYEFSLFFDSMQSQLCDLTNPNASLVYELPTDNHAVILALSLCKYSQNSGDFLISVSYSSVVVQRSSGSVTWYRGFSVDVS